MKVSNLAIKNNMVHQIRKNYHELTKTETQLNTGKRYQNVSEHTPQAITSIYSKIRTNQIEQFTKNAEDSESYINVAHDKINMVNQMMQRIRELNIQGANGSFSKEDRHFMAIEVEDLLKEMVSQANSIYQDNYLFSGSVDQKPFVVTYATERHLNREVISGVEYVGDDFTQKREIGQHERVEISLPGNHAFWGVDHSIVSLKDNTGYLSLRDQKIKVDGHEVSIDVNDNLDRIIEKINQSVPTVTAFKQDLPNGTESIGFESQYPHRIFFEDIEGGSFLREVGMLKEGEEGTIPPNNLHSNILEKKGSIFDVVINLRNNLVQSNMEDLSNRTLNSVDQAMNNLLKNQAKISSVKFRLENVRKDLAMEIVNLRERISKSEDMDIAEATIRFNELNSIHQLGLKASARFVRPTLLDYL